MLAASLAPRPGDRAWELGSGVGTVSLCLATRVPGVEILGVEIQPDLVTIANANSVVNGLSDRVQFLAGDVDAPPGELVAGSFDHAMMNPPFFVEGPADPSPDESRRLAASTDEAALARWTKAAQKFLKPKGTLTAILPADRVPAMLAALDRGFGGVILFPLWPRAGEPAKRILIRAVKGSRAPFALRAGLVLHGESKHTEQAEAILRHGAGLTL